MMGGWGSGGRSDRRTPPALEALCRIDLQAYGKEGYLAAGSCTMTEVTPGRRGLGGLCGVTLSVTADGDRVVVDLDYGDTANGTTVAIDLVLRPSPLGERRGTFWLGRCPGCCRLCRVFYVSASQIACHGCHGNLYRLQRLAPLARARLQRRRVLARLGVDERHQGPIDRPKRMNSRTYSRLTARAAVLQHIIDGEEERLAASMNRYLDGQERRLQALRPRLPALLLGEQAS